MAYESSQVKGQIRAAHATAAAAPDPSSAYDLRCSSWQRWILNPVSEAKDRSLMLVDTSRVHDR